MGKKRPSPQRHGGTENQKKRVFHHQGTKSIFGCALRALKAFFVLFESSCLRGSILFVPLCLCAFVVKTQSSASRALSETRH